MTVGASRLWRDYPAVFCTPNFPLEKSLPFSYIDAKVKIRFNL